ncbi:hypothetical protein SAMN05421858_0252 [Haladaptatus litoreus]|uniref:Dolichyl-phosphate-mannose-protein mannosyltransferase n=1 Tax=Haladaptatus litoreus TaxID=553468 RepID=A0A1N6V887_9EURY|nr:hypothetical protein [Haladaptatus litoreus]SIQ74104.1 hypothetical protein SAMN05421858_0252 [Haladaptatus litoreus]
MHVLSSKRETLESSTFIVPVFLLLGVLETMNRYMRIQAGAHQPHVDVRCCWRPLAEAALAGKPIYVRPAVDNKPPLFELLNIAVAATGQYLLVFFVLVGFANAAIAILLWRICAQRDASRVGLVAGLLFLTSVPAAGGTVVNVRSFAIAGILLSLSVSHPVARGATIAAAGLFSQHAVFAIPALAYDRLRKLDRDSGIRCFASFSLAGIGVVAVTFGFVYAVWGQASFHGAIYWSFGAAEKYTTNPVVPSLIGDTSRWMSALYREALKHLVLIVPATIVAQLAFTARGAERPALSTNAPVLTTGLLALSMTAPLFVRAYRAYWLYPLPFLALLASVGYQEFFKVAKE